MNVYVFGAGASKGAQEDFDVLDRAIAPLTNDLFDPRYWDFATEVGLSHASVSEYRTKIDKFDSLEIWLTEEWNKISSYKQNTTAKAHKGSMARINFYVWNLLRNVSKWVYDNNNMIRERNAYVTLLKKIKSSEEKFGFINFNYDLLLDYAYKDVFNVVFHSLGHYLDNNYVKPHGSINWFLEKRSDDVVIDLNREISMDTRVRIDTAVASMYRDSPLALNTLLVKEPNHRDIFNTDALLESFGKQYFYPLIFLPLTLKTYSSISGFEDQILTKAREMAKKATEIFLIGYRANDDIIGDILSNAPKDTKVSVVGMESADKIMEKILNNNPHLSKGIVYKKGFKTFAIEQK